MSSSIGSDNVALIGRREELDALVRNLRKGRHTLLVGERGIGKSRLLREAVAVLKGESHHLGVGEGSDPPPIIWVQHCSPMGDMLKEICARLHAGEKLIHPFREVDAGDWDAIKKKLHGLGSIGVQSMAIDSLKGYEKRPVVILDSLDRITAAQVPFLERLMGVSVVGAAVSLVKLTGTFARVRASFARVPVGPLTVAESEEMVERVMEAHPAKILDRRMYVRQVVKAAGGNPFHLTNLVWAGALSGRVTVGEMRELQQVEEGELLNMGPAYIFLASGFTLFKIFSVGTDKSEFYVYFSALGFVVYLTFRVFRTFFLFRSKRES